MGVCSLSPLLSDTLHSNWIGSNQSATRKREEGEDEEKEEKEEEDTFNESWDVSKKEKLDNVSSIIMTMMMTLTMTMTMKTVRRETKID